MSDRGTGSPPGEHWEKALRPLVGKKVESVRVDDYGVVYITAAGFGGRVVAKIGEPETCVIYHRFECAPIL